MGFLTGDWATLIDPLKSKHSFKCCTYVHTWQYVPTYIHKYLGPPTEGGREQNLLSHHVFQIKGELCWPKSTVGEKNSTLMQNGGKNRGSFPLGVNSNPWVRGEMENRPLAGLCRLDDCIHSRTGVSAEQWEETARWKCWAGWPGEFGEKMAQNAAQTIFWEKMFV
jgi:hypothetical protein